MLLCSTPFGIRGENSVPPAVLEEWEARAQRLSASEGKTGGDRFRVLLAWDRAQRLSASEGKTEHFRKNATHACCVCSTPFGI